LKSLQKRPLTIRKYLAKKMQFSIHLFTVFLVAFLAACSLALADPEVHTTLSLHVGALHSPSATEFL
jgi:hypothetical protein